MAVHYITIEDLVGDGIVKVGQTFFARDYMGTIIDSENIKIEYAGDGLDPRNMGNRLYKSFSKPANQICGYNVNAWFFWKYFKGEKAEQRPIDDWRQEWLDLFHQLKK